MSSNEQAGKSYVIRAAPKGCGDDLLQPGPLWRNAREACIDHFRPEGSSHRPKTIARLLHSANGIYGMFEVDDRFVRCVRHGYQSEVWKDSCVEVFLRPDEKAGYFNFEFNCGGSWLCNFIRDSRRTDAGFADSVAVSRELARQVKVRSSLPEKVEPEIVDPIHWTLNFFIPYSMMESFVGPLRPPNAQPWSGNFFKCAEDVSHPHWASWSPVDEFNFHMPNCFGRLEFANGEGVTFR